MKTCRAGQVQIALLSLVMSFLLTHWSYAGEGRWEDPWEGHPPPGSERINTISSSAGQWVAEGGLHIFRKYISPVDGDRCPSYPSCSQYSAEAIRKHGALLGFLLTIDRLIHEADEVRRAPLVRIQDDYRYYDPLENNDFWWRKK